MNKFLVILLLFFVIQNLTFSFDTFKNRIKILVYNQYPSALTNWPGKVTFNFKDLNITNCSSIEVNSSLLTTEDNVVLPFQTFCDNKRKKVYLFFQLNSLNINQLKPLYFYYNGKNDLEIIKNPIKIESSSFIDSIFGNSCRYKITFPLPNLKYEYNNITFNFSFPNYCINCVYRAYIDNCYQEVFGTENVHHLIGLKPCINKKMFDKKSNVTITFETLGQICQNGNFNLVFKYPSPFHWGLDKISNEIFNSFLKMVLKNSEININNPTSEVKLNWSNSYFYIGDNKNVVVNNSENEIDKLKKIQLNLQKIFSDDIDYYLENRRVNFLNYYETPYYYAFLNLRGFSPWFSLYIKFKNYYKFKTRLYIENHNLDTNGNLITYSNAYLNLTINKRFLPVYYYHCTDLKIFANYTSTGTYEEVPYRVNNVDNDHCYLTLFIKHLDQNLALDFYSYNLFDYLNDNKELPQFNYPVYINTNNLVLNWKSEKNYHNLYSKLSFNFNFTVNGFDSIKLGLKNPQSGEINYGDINQNSEYDDTQDYLLDSLLFQKENESFLITFNHYIGKSDENQLIKGVKGMRIKFKKLGNSFINSIKTFDSKINDFFFAVANLNQYFGNDFYEKTLNIDIDNPYKVKEFLTVPFAFMKNDFDMYYYTTTFSSIRKGEDLFNFYQDFVYFPLEDYKGFIDGLKIIVNSNFEIENDSLILYPNTNEGLDGTTINFVSTPNSYQNANLEVSFSVNNANIYIGKNSNLHLISCPLENNKTYLLFAHFNGNSVNYEIYDKNFNNVCTGSFSTDDYGKISIGVNSNVINDNGDLHFIKLYAIKVYELQNSYSLPLALSDNGESYTLNTPSPGIYIVKINNEERYLKGNFEYCYLDDKFRCTYKVTNLIEVKTPSSSVLLKPVVNNYFYIYNIIKPKYYLVNNDKQINLNALNAILGIPIYNLIWKNKFSYYFFGSNYPITTRKGKIIWKILRGLHIYTPFVQYSLVDYPFTSYLISKLSYQLSNEKINIIK